MTTDNIDTINFLDSESGDSGCAIVRAVDGSVGLCLSLESDGDIEVFLSCQETETLIKALQRAIAVAAGSI
jgi:hypothetical protein